MKKTATILICCILIIILTGCGKASCTHPQTALQGAVAATCTQDGATGDTVCTKCGEILMPSAVLEATGHKLHYEGGTAPTCVSAGNTGTGICSLCGEVLAEDIPMNPLGHAAVLQNERPATCQEEGYSGDLFCSTCGVLLEAGTTLKRTSHITELRNAVEATCQQEGYSGDSVCINCGGLVSPGTVISKLNHSPALRDAVAATCTERGYSGDSYCTVCGTTLSIGNYLLPLNHCDTELRNAREATPESDGYTGDTFCRSCGILLSQGQTILRLPAATQPVDGTFSNDSGLAMTVFNAINEERAKAGIAPLLWDGNLVAACTIRANEYRTWALTNSAANAHNRPDGRDYSSVFSDTGVPTIMAVHGENLAGNSYSGALVSSWMNSSGHRANILRTDYTCAAVAVIYDGSTYWACNLFWG